MRFFGLLLVFGALFLLLYEEFLKRKKMIREYGSVLRFIEILDRGFENNSEGLYESIGMFCESEKEDTLFLAKISSVIKSKKEENFAYIERKNISDMDFLENSKDSEKIKTFLQNFGKRTFEEEKGALLSIKRYMKEREEQLSEKLNTDKKLAGVVYTAVFVGVFILII